MHTCDKQDVSLPLKVIGLVDVSFMYLQKTNEGGGPPLRILAICFLGGFLLSDHGAIFLNLSSRVYISFMSMG